MGHAARLAPPRASAGAIEPRHVDARRHVWTAGDVRLWRIAPRTSGRRCTLPGPHGRWGRRLAVRVRQQYVADDASSSAHAPRNCRSVLRVAPNSWNSADRHAVGVVGAAEVRELLVECIEDAAATGSSMRSTGSMPLALSRTCHSNGGEMTTSPPTNSLQCMWLRNAADSSRVRNPRSLEDLVGLLEDRDAGPLQVRRGRR